MALVLGDNVGFVLVAPTADPAGSNVTIDGSSVVVKHTSPAGATKITEIGWYRGAGTNAANFEIALYAESGGVAAARLFVDATNSSTVQGWITVAVDWAISANTAYWIAVQMDAHSGTSSIDAATSGGVGSDILTSQTTLANPYGGGAVADADGMYAIYAKVNVDKVATPDFGELTITGFEPTVVASNNIIISALLGVLTLVGFEPTAVISDNKVVSPDFGQVIVTGFEPTIGIGAGVAPGFGDVVLTGFEPTAVVTNHKNILADVGSAVMTGFESTIQTPKNLLADVGVVLLTGSEPVVLVTDHKIIQPDVGVVIVTGFEPSVNASSGAGANPDVGQLLMNGFAPVVTASDHKVIQSDVGVLLITGLEPIVVASNHKVVLPDLGQLLLNGFEPVVVVSDSRVVSPDVGQLVFNGHEPSLGSGFIEVEPDFGEVIISSFEPVVDVTVDPVELPDDGVVSTSLSGIHSIVAVVPNVGEVDVGGHLVAHDSISVQNVSSGHNIEYESL